MPDQTIGHYYGSIYSAASEYVNLTFAYLHLTRGFAAELFQFYALGRELQVYRNIDEIRTTTSEVEYMNALPGEMEDLIWDRGGDWTVSDESIHAELVSGLELEARVASFYGVKWEAAAGSRPISSPMFDHRDLIDLAFSLEAPARKWPDSMLPMLQVYSHIRHACEDPSSISPHDLRQDVLGNYSVTTRLRCSWRILREALQESQAALQETRPKITGSWMGNEIMLINHLERGAHVLTIQIESPEE